MRLLNLCLIACSLSCGTEPEYDRLNIVSFNVRWDAPGDGPNRWQYRRQGVVNYMLQEPRLLGALQELTPAQVDDLQAEVSGDYLWSERAHVTALIPPGYETLRTQILDLPGSGFARAATMVELRRGGRRMTFVSVHLSGGPDGLMQTQVVLDALHGWARPWVVAGDFNAYAMPTEDCLRLSAEYHPLCNQSYDLMLQAGFVDPVVALHGVRPNSTATGFRPSNERWQPGFDARIDWVMTTSELVPGRAWIPDPLTEAGRPLSDHRPVQVQLRFGPADSDPDRPIRAEPEPRPRALW